MPQGVAICLDSHVAIGPGARLPRCSLQGESGPVSSGYRAGVRGALFGGAVAGGCAAGASHLAPAGYSRRGYFDDASSSSMMFLKLSKGCAPDTRRPLMMKPGVPRTPTELPSCISASTLAAVFWLSKQSSHFFWSMPEPARYSVAFCFTLSLFTCAWFSKKPL